MLSLSIDIIRVILHLCDTKNELVEIWESILADSLTLGFLFCFGGWGCHSFPMNTALILDYFGITVLAL